MEIALNCNNKEPIDALELWVEFNGDESAIRENSFKCIACGVELIPASFKPDNKNRPYFKTKKDVNHFKDCNSSINKFDKSIKKFDKKQYDENIDDIPFPFPSKLTLPKDKKESEQQKNHQSISSNSGNSLIKNDNNINKSKKIKNTGYRTAYINQIAERYISLPNKREYLPLDCSELGIDGQNYKECIKRIDYFNNWPKYYHIKNDKELEEAEKKNQIYALFKEEENYKYKQNAKKIFFNKMHWFNFKFNINECVVEIYPTGHDEKYTILRINTSNWSENQKKSLENKIEITSGECIESKQSKKQKYAYVFFVGEQVSNLCFTCSNYNLITFVISDKKNEK